MLKKIIDIIGMILISLTIVIFSLIIGANEKAFRILPITILFCLYIIYLIIKKIVFKEKIVVKNKFDIFVLMFFLTIILPYIFKTYCTYQSTVEFILKYFFVYGFYLMIRNTIDNKNKVNIIIIVTILSSLIIAILGFDIMGSNHLSKMVEKLNLYYTPSYAFTSIFGYANTVAVYFSFCVFLSIHQIYNNSKSNFSKILYLIYILMSICIIFKTVSRATYVLFGLSLIIFFIWYYIKKIKEHKKETKTILLVLFSIIILALLFIFLVGIRVSKPYTFDDDVYQRNFNYNFEKNKEYTLKLELEIKEDVTSDKDNNDDNKDKDNDNDDIILSILEINEYFYEDKISYKNIGLKDKQVEINFKTSDDLYQIDMLIENKNNNKITINKCYINDTQYPINYKYLPYELGRALSLYMSNDKGICQRFDFWEICIKIFREHPIIGSGGNAWKYLEQAYEMYPYFSKETHSYFFEILISYGLIGVCALLILLISYCYKVVKNCIKDEDEKKFKLPIFIGLNVILIHSIFFDFNMSFILILLLVFGYMGMLNYNLNDIDKKENKENKVDKEDNIKDKKINKSILVFNISDFKFVDYIVFVLLILLAIILILGSIAKYANLSWKDRSIIGFYNASYRYDYIEQRIRKKDDFKFILDDLKKFMTEEPNYMVMVHTVHNQNNVYENYIDLLINNLDLLNDDELICYLDFLISHYKTYKYSTPMYIYSILGRAEPMVDLYVELQKKDYTNDNIRSLINELNNIIDNEYKVNIVNIEDRKRNWKTEDEIEIIRRRYEEILDRRK